MAVAEPRTKIHPNYPLNFPGATDERQGLARTLTFDIASLPAGTTSITRDLERIAEGLQVLEVKVVPVYGKISGDQLVFEITGADALKQLHPMANEVFEPSRDDETILRGDWYRDVVGELSAGSNERLQEIVTNTKTFVATVVESPGTYFIFFPDRRDER